MKFTLKDTFVKELPADPILENEPRQVKNACFSYVTPKKTSNPKLLHVSPEMLAELGLDIGDSQSKEFLNTFTGNIVLPNTKPYAMCYGGYQFGHWAGQLGDGRAINLAQVKHNNKQWTLQLKGAGETPYSRTADGLAVLRSSVREYLCSEAMFHLGVPTTRALSLSLTGDQVLRDMLYDGNAGYENGAVICRVATSFLRFGSYQIFAARQDTKTLKTVVDYTIQNYFSHLGKPSKQVYLQFFEEVLDRTITMIVHWQRVGFVHGVMNTDNMSILGETIDYGPYGWLEGYDHGWTPNTTDNQHKRYRYGAQLDIGLWNLYQLANALFPIINEAEGLEAILKTYNEKTEEAYLHMMSAKLGLANALERDAELIYKLEEVLQLTETDMTLFFRKLADFSNDDIASEGFSIIKESFYSFDEINEAIKRPWITWFENYAVRLKEDSLSAEERKTAMNKTNPKYVLRNYMSQLAIDEADKGNYDLIDELFNLLKKPYDEQPEREKWFAKRPEWARNKVGCSMLSCSS
ncbi:protein adenylyltransferase SelO [Patiriisocius sp. Uisw_017]|jgi:uncharacterized protein YdiU (UPF0061 family)|uniref:protein adenylyltransferase SelO n=1 Tax=Patiriisocius sp. Uisw_017 TaxID=3230968 RepID=UPI0039ED0705